MQSNGNAMKEGFISPVISCPFRVQDFVMFFGDLLLLCLAVWLLVIFVLRLRKLFRRSDSLGVENLNRENSLCLAVGWIGLAIGFICTWCGFHSTWSQCSSMLQWNSESDVVAMIFLSSSKADIRPFMIGCLVFMFSQFRRVVILYLMEKLERSGARSGGDSPNISN